jgi:hypothetical protein
MTAAGRHRMLAKDARDRAQIDFLVVIGDAINPNMHFLLKISAKCRGIREAFLCGALCASFDAHQSAPSPEA